MTEFRPRPIPINPRHGALPPPRPQTAGGADDCIPASPQGCATIQNLGVILREVYRRVDELNRMTDELQSAMEGISGRTAKMSEALHDFEDEEARS